MHDKSEENNRVIDPNTSGYVDRKMAKWQGLILSEHAELLKEEKKNKGNTTEEKEKQTPEEIYSLIDDSFSRKEIIAIQLDCLFNGQYEEDLVGVVCGYYENSIYVQTIDAGLVVCELELIRNVEKTETPKWFRV
ncbi:hypothetical protein [Desemzia sp. FAM 23991]|uniref:hypothetical protein n=1 Tax=unclassified Desemzia TaxID=2685243 RepID=UPI0038847DC9